LKLNKWMIAGAAILVFAGVAPWGVGYVTEQQWLQATEEVNSTQPFVRMETDQYQRGVMGSEASGSLTIVDPKTGDSHRIDFQFTVSHGVTGSLLDFRPSQGWQPEGADWFQDAEPSLTLETRLWGSATVEFQAPPMALEHPDGAESVRTSGGLARIDIGSMGEQADILMVWPELVLSGPRMNVKVEGFHLEQSMSWLVGGIWTGSGAMTLDSIALEGAAVPAVLVEGVALNSGSEATDGEEKLDSNVVLELESVQFGDKAYGPHRLEVAIEGVDVAGWNDFSSAMTDMQMMAVTGGADPRAAFEQQMAVMQRFNDSIRGLAAAGFSVGIRELSLETTEGKVRGSLDISHPELSEEERENMLMVMQQLTGTLDFSMPLALAETYPVVQMQVSPLIKQGLLVREGDQLVMNGRMEDLVLDVNGVQIPLPPLL